MSDYRCPDFVTDYAGIKKKKQNLDRILTSKLRNRNNDYSHISSEAKWKSEFSQVYGERCAYCGVSTAVEPLRCFQIDHLVATSRGGGNNLDNLIFSCVKCNQKKKNKELPLDDVFHPDSETIGEVFVRNPDFTLSISDRYKDNVMAQVYFNVLRLDEWKRSLDYSLSVLCELRELELIKFNYRLQVSDIICDILNIRNRSI